MKPKFANRRHLFTSAIAFAFAGLTATSASAADQTYDAANASNVWDTTTSNWDASAAVWTNGNNAIFNGTGESVAVDGAITVANLTFSTAGFTIAPGTGTFALAAGTNTVTATTGTSTISALVGGTGAISKAGTGTLVLSNAGNTFSGGFTNTAGTTLVSGTGTGTTGVPTAGALGTGTVTLSGGTISNTGTASTTLFNNLLASAATTLNNGGGANGVNFMLNGALSGSANVVVDCNAGAGFFGGIHLLGDNSAYSGTITLQGNSQARHKFDSANAGSAAAKWVLNGPTDSCSMNFHSAERASAWMPSTSNRRST
ncbi:MAG: hypothetical protein KDN05_00685 [Verrucomicrobiae bacterium]|nr:hypothetical protein [Verrucomicrobiae bacterium]MCP5532301.1 hypothetical protein [Akkermansiaceae bacterium]